MLESLNPLLESYSPRTIEKAAFSTYRKLRKQGFSDQDAYNKVILKFMKPAFRTPAFMKTYDKADALKRNLERSYLDGKISWGQLEDKLKPLRNLANSQNARRSENSKATISALGNFTKAFGKPKLSEPIKKSPSNWEIFKKIHL